MPRTASGRVSFSGMAVANAHEQASDRSPVPGGSRVAELDRLERAVRALIDQQASLQLENARLRESLDESEHAVEAGRAALEGLEERLLGESERRQDAIKRIEDLVRLLEKLDPRLGGAAAKRG